MEKHSRPVTTVELLNTISANDSVSGDEISHASSDDYTSLTQFPEDVQTNLVQIAEWLCSNDREDFMNVYANIRAHMMKKSLEQMRDHQKSASMGSQGRGVSPARTISGPVAATAQKKTRRLRPRGCSASRAVPSRRVRGSGRTSC